MKLKLKFMVEKNFEPKLRALGYQATRRRRLTETWYIVDETIGGFRTWLHLREDKPGRTASINLRRQISENETDEKIVAVAFKDVAKMKLLIAGCEKKEKCVVNRDYKTFTRGNVSVTLDNVENLGRFVKVETNGEENEADIARLNAVVDEIGLEQSLRIGSDYPEMLKKRKKR